MGPDQLDSESESEIRVITKESIWRHEVPLNRWNLRGVGSSVDI